MCCEKMKVASFDVFDTCLSRKVANPYTVFQIMQNMHKDLPYNFPELRTETERKLFSLIGFDPTLEEVYVDIEKQFKIYSVDELVKMEEEIESTLLLPIYITLDKIKSYRAQNYQIIFISDTTHSSSFIKNELIKYNFFHESDFIFVSSEAKATKRKGTLYDFIQMKMKPNDWIHTGDNRHSDFIQAQMKGLIASYFQSPNLNRYEKLLVDRFRELSIQYHLATARFCRINSKHELPSYTISYNIISPLLINYVFWILESAKKKKIKELFFVARDGQILYKIANIIQKYLAFDISLNYMYGSRQAWNFPSFEGCNERFFLWLFRLNTESGLTIESIKKRLWIEDDDFFKNLPLTHNQILNDQDIEIIKLFLINNEKKIFEFSNNARNEALKYFSKIGFKCESTQAIVDLTGTGQLQTSLCDIFKINDLNGFYFGITPLNHIASKGYFHTFAFCDAETSKQWNINPIEIFTSALHGGCEKYSDGEPILDSEETVQLIKDQHDSIELYCSMYFTITNGIFFPMDLIHLNNLLDLFVIKPSSQEAELYGKYNFSDSQSNDFYTEFAPIITITDLLLKRKRKTMWMAASIVRSSYLIKLYYGCKKIGRILKEKINENF